MNKLTLTVQLLSILWVKSIPLFDNNLVTNELVVITIKNGFNKTHDRYRYVLNPSLKNEETTDRNVTAIGYLVKEEGPGSYSVKLKRLIPGTKYSVNIEILDEKYKKSVKFIGEFFTKPSQTENFTRIEEDEESIFIEWTKPYGNFDGYLVEWQEKNSPWISNRIYIEKKPKAPWANINGVRCGQSYRISVYAVSFNNEKTEMSKPLTIFAKTRLCPPTNVQLFTKAFYTNITWDPPAKECQFNYYLILHKQGNSGEFKPIHLNTNELADQYDKVLVLVLYHFHYGLKCLLPGRYYQIVIYSCLNDEIDQDKDIYSNPIYQSLVTRPNPVSNLKSFTVNSTKIYVEWTSSDISKQSSYIVVYLAKPWVRSRCFSKAIKEVTNTSILLTDVKPDCHYWISVIAKQQSLGITHTSIVTTIKHTWQEPFFGSIIRWDIFSANNSRWQRY